MYALLSSVWFIDWRLFWIVNGLIRIAESIGVPVSGISPSDLTCSGFIRNVALGSSIALGCSCWTVADIICLSGWMPMATSLLISKGLTWMFERGGVPCGEGVAATGVTDSVLGDRFAA